MARSGTDKSAGPGARTPLDRALGAARGLSRFATWVSGFALIAVCILVMAEVLLRKFLGVTLGGMDEITGYVLAVSVTWTLAYALFEQAHIRIDVLYNLADGRSRGGLDLISLIAMTGFVLTVTYWAGQLLKSTLKFGSTSNTALQVPLWIPQSLWLAGLVFFSVTLLLICLRALTYLRRGDIAGVSRIAGIKSVADEVEEQTAVSTLDHATQG